MATQQELLIKIKGDIADIEKKLGNVQKNLAKTEKSTGSLAKAFTKSAKVVAAAGAAIAGAAVLIGKKSLDAAARVEEMENKFNVVFKNSSADMNAWADNFAKAIGRNSTEIKEAISNQADLMIGMGMTEEQAGSLAQQYTELAYDLASFNNVNDAQAVDAMTKMLMGETEAMKALGVNVSDTVMEKSEFVEASGKAWKEMDMEEKAMYRLMEAQKQSVNALGDATRSAESYTNQKKRLNGAVEKLYETIGEKLLPVFTPLVSAFADMIEKLTEAINFFGDAYDATGSFTDALAATADFMGLPWLGDFIIKLKDMYDWIKQIPEKLKEWEQPLTFAAILVGSLALAIGAYALAQNWALITTAIGVGGLTAWSAVCGVASAVTGVLAGVMAFLASPITKVILAIGAVIAITYLLVKNWDEVKEWLKETWENIKEKAVEIWEGIKEYFSNLWNNIKETACNVWNSIKDFFSNLWQGIKDTATNIWNSIKEFFSGLWQSIKDKCVSAWNSIKESISTIWNNTIQWVKDKANGMINFFKELPGSMLQIGKDIFNGLWNGLKSVWSSITGWITEKANWIKDKFKSILGIHSPSREFMKIGMFVDEGLIKGLEDGEVDINSQVTGMAEGLKTGFNSSFDGAEGGTVAAGASNTTINLNGSYMFQDKESMDYFMNKLALAVQRG